MEVIFGNRHNEECGCGSKDVWWSIVNQSRYSETIYFCNECADELRKQLNI